MLAKVIFVNVLLAFIACTSQSQGSDCPGTICPVSSALVSKGASCTRACPEPLADCTQDSDCAVTDMLCCGDDDLTSLMPVSVAGKGRYEEFRATECAAGESGDALRASSHCVAGCGISCRGALKPVCQQGRCSLTSDNFSQYHECFNDCSLGGGSDGGTSVDAGQ